MVLTRIFLVILAAEAFFPSSVAQGLIKDFEYDAILASDPSLFKPHATDLAEDISTGSSGSQFLSSIPGLLAPQHRDVNGSQIFARQRTCPYPVTCGGGSWCCPSGMNCCPMYLTRNAAPPLLKRAAADFVPRLDLFAVAPMSAQLGSPATRKVVENSAAGQESLRAMMLAVLPAQLAVPCPDIAREL
ncbi:hypothetical protein CVT24_007815 [Panaeolus cyanescens]|uniref:Granulins domain-containing protein n=1 Tax=Panaeolus cyanescens TaxID=181874 RepID=A0A409WLB8_9AGAR|nr:hypothetical protein CVT24_007815 [Panaeolus cyanescens]